jgi:DNA mismatch repair ATPase MutS
VILDEIGRGTSTLDGLSLAWAIAETLADRGCRTLFATHYHEITSLADRLPAVTNLHVAVREWEDRVIFLHRILPGRTDRSYGIHVARLADRLPAVTNLHVAVREWEDRVIFLHRILPGRTDRSYGIHVARLAGLPPETVARARELLETLAVETEATAGKAREAIAKAPAAKSRTEAGGQLSLFTEFLPHPAVEALKAMKIEELTPLAAFDALRTLKQSVERPGE